jgi:hypothetical protein
VLTLGWRFKNETRSDPWSRRFNQFKFGPRDSVVDAALAVTRIAFFGWSWPEQTVGFTAALSSQDSALDPQSRIARLAQGLARHTGRGWHGELLRKDTYRAVHNTRQIARHRARTVHCAYRCVRDLDCDTLIVCDDLVTTGDTFTEIARAVHEHHPHVDVIGFALAKTEDRAFAAMQRQFLSNDHLPDTWARLWDDHD